MRFCMSGRISTAEPTYQDCLAYRRIGDASI
jgi:hypothetical protein